MIIGKTKMLRRPLLEGQVSGLCNVKGCREIAMYETEMEGSVSKDLMYVQTLRVCHTHKEELAGKVKNFTRIPYIIHKKVIRSDAEPKVEQDAYSLHCMKCGNEWTPRYWHPEQKDDPRFGILPSKCTGCKRMDYRRSD